MNIQVKHGSQERSTGADGLTWQKLARVIKDAGRYQPISLREAVRRLAMSPRTLQRRLRDEGYTHRHVITLVRRELAFELLSQCGGNIDEVAHRLGFSGAAAFHRAFKRWTGVTPGEFRRSRCPAALP